MLSAYIFLFVIAVVAATDDDVLFFSFCFCFLLFVCLYALFFPFAKLDLFRFPTWFSVTNILNIYIYYPTAPPRVQITPKTSTNITRYLYPRGPVRQVSCC